MVFISDSKNLRASNKNISVKRRWLFISIGVLFMLIVWQLLSMFFSEYVIASPSATLKALGQLAVDGTLWKEFGNSLVRLLIGLVGGAIIGVTLGILAGIWKHFKV